MKIDYVVSTMVFWWREHNLSFELECDFLRSLGFGVEIWPTIRAHNECRFNRSNWTRLKLATEGMKVMLHGRVDGPTSNQWREQLECAKMLNAPLSTHLESLCVSDTLNVADWNFAKEIVDMAQEIDVPLCAETGQLETMLELHKRFPSIGFCFNTGHAKLNKDATFNKYVDALAGNIEIVHLTDNYGEIDDHQPPGIYGGIPDQNWNYLLDALKKQDKDIIASFEMFPSMPGVLIKKASGYIFDKLNWPDEPEKSHDHLQRHYRPF